MIIDHIITKENTKSIKKDVDALGRKATELNNKKGEIVKSNLLTDFAKAEKKKVLNDEFTQYAWGIVERIEKQLAIIRDREIENEKIFNVTDEAVVSSLKIVETMGKDLPLETMKNIVNGLRGYKQALIVVKAAFEKYGIDKKYINKHIIDAESEYDELIEITKSIPANVDSSLSNIYLLYKNMFGTAELLGVSFTDEEKRVSFDLEEYQKSLAARVMGVNTSGK